MFCGLGDWIWGFKIGTWNLGLIFGIGIRDLGLRSGMGIGMGNWVALKLTAGLSWAKLSKIGTELNTNLYFVC